MAMAIAGVVGRFSKTSPIKRVAIIFSVCGVIAAVFYFFFYSDLVSKGKSLSAEIDAAQTQKADLEAKREKFNNLRREVTELEDRQKVGDKVLPSRIEIHSFLQSLHATAEVSQLNILSFTQRPERVERYYAQIPVRMTITGTYHQLTKFFYELGRMRRIVSVKNVKLSADKYLPESVRLKASFEASTFRFLAPGESSGKSGRGRRKG
jgi:type IV pilus assembly protein PilO